MNIVHRKSDPLFDRSNEHEFTSYSRRDFVRLLFKHKRIILLSFFTVTLLLFISYMIVPTSYVVSAKVLIKTEHEGKPVFFSGVAAYKERVRMDPINRKIETEMELIESRPVAEQVVKELDLKYDQVYRKSISHLIDTVKDGVTSVFGILRSSKDKKIDNKVIVSAFMKSIKVEPVRSKSADTNSNIIQVSIKTPNPAVGKKALSKLLAIYASFELKINHKAGENAYAIVKKKMEQSYESLATAQLKLKQFLANKKFLLKSSRSRISTSFVNGSEPATTTISPSSISNLAGKMISSPRDDTTIAVLKAKLIEMELQLVEYRQNYRGRNEKVTRLKSSINLLRKRLDHEMSAYAENESQLRTLERDLQASESVYLQLKKRLTQIDLFMEINKKQPGTRIIVEPPMIPLDSEKKKDIIIIMAGSFGGLVLGLGLAGFREYVDHNFRDKHDVLRHLGLDTIATIPKIDLEDVYSAEQDIQKTINA